MLIWKPNHVKQINLNATWGINVINLEPISNENHPFFPSLTPLCIYLKREDSHDSTEIWHSISLNFTKFFLWKLPLSQNKITGVISKTNIIWPILMEMQEINVSSSTTKGWNICGQIFPCFLSAFRSDFHRNQR